MKIACFLKVKQAEFNMSGNGCQNHVIMQRFNWVFSVSTEKLLVKKWLQGERKILQFPVF